MSQNRCSDCHDEGFWEQQTPTGRNVDGEPDFFTERIACTCPYGKTWTARQARIDDARARRAKQLPKGLCDE